MVLFGRGGIMWQDFYDKQMMGKNGRYTSATIVIPSGIVPRSAGNFQISS
jgi:hypothetical protein